MCRESPSKVEGGKKGGVINSAVQRIIQVGVRQRIRRLESSHTETTCEGNNVSCAKETTSKHLLPTTCPHKHTSISRSCEKQALFPSLHQLAPNHPSSAKRARYGSPPSPTSLPNSPPLLMPSPCVRRRQADLRRFRAKAEASAGRSDGPSA